MKKFTAIALLLVIALTCGCSASSKWPLSGAIDGRTYTCEDAKIKLTVPDGYTILDHSGLIEQYGLGADYYDNLADKTEYYEFGFQNDSGSFLLSFNKKSSRKPTPLSW